MLALYFHPLASFCWKVLVALYENATPFEPKLVDLADEESRRDFFALWPLGQFPVLVDGARIVPESSIIIEYLDRQHPGPTRWIPADVDLEVRARDRFFDLHVHQHMQKIVTDRIRPDGGHDPHGVAQARTQLAAALDLLDRQMATRRWAAGYSFTLADCAAAPALYYADRVQPFAATHPNAAAYLQRLLDRPSVARVIEEAGPYFKFFPG